MTYNNVNCMTHLVFIFIRIFTTTKKHVILSDDTNQQREANLRRRRNGMSNDKRDQREIDVY